MILVYCSVVSYTEQYMQTKTCRVCQQEKKAEEFYRSPVYKDGLVPKCKDCIREYDKELCGRPRDTPTEKVCCRCHKTKSRDAFHARTRNRDGLRSECKDCTRTQEHSYRHRHPHIEYLRKVKATYGLTEDAYLALVAQHNGRCPVCKQDHDLVVDHNHVTGTVRGLLCKWCNIGLGSFGDNPERLRAAAEYLEEHDERVVPTT